MASASVQQRSSAADVGGWCAGLVSPFSSTDRCWPFTGVIHRAGSCAIRRSGCVGAAAAVHRAAASPHVLLLGFSVSIVTPVLPIAMAVHGIQAAHVATGCCT